MNRGQLINSVALKAGLDDTTASEELSLMQGWANDGVVEVLLETHCYVQIGNVALSPSVGDYRIDPNVLAITDDTLTSNGQGYGVERVPVDEILARRRGSSATDVPRYFANQGDLFMVYPTPSSADTLQIVYVPKPTVMSDDLHDPSSSTYGGIPSQHHRAIEYYMLWQAAEYDEKRLPESPKDYAQQFVGECAKVRKRMRGLGNRRLAPARIGYPNRFRPRRNDQYPN